MNGATSTTSTTKPRWRRKRWLLAAVLALVIVPGAIAGWVIYSSTASGTATAKITSTNTTADVVTFVANAGSTPAIVPSSPVTPTNLVVTATNNGTAPEKLATLTAPTITDDASGGHLGTCAALVQFNTATAIADTVTTPIPVGTTSYTFPGVVTASNSMQGYCSNATITFTWPVGTGGTTNP